MQVRSQRAPAAAPPGPPRAILWAVKLRSKQRNPAERMRFAVNAMPRFAREAMLRGIDTNTVIAGAYTDPKTGGVCPMLAAHRNGGRTSLASFARSWDRYTDARRPRLATEREVRALRSYLEMSLVADATGEDSLAASAERIRAERAAAPPTVSRRRPSTRRVVDGRPTGETFRGHELAGKRRWAWILPARRLDVYEQRIAAASEAMAERSAGEMLGAPDSSGRDAADTRERSDRIGSRRAVEPALN